MKVFFDTNVWLSAIVFPGLCAELLATLAETEHELLSSELVRAETHEVLRRKFPRHDEAMALFELLWAEARCLPDMDSPADDADARLVKAAAQGGGGSVRDGRPAGVGVDGFGGNAHCLAQGGLGGVGHGLISCKHRCTHARA